MSEAVMVMDIAPGITIPGIIPVMAPIGIVRIGATAGVGVVIMADGIHRGMTGIGVHHGAGVVTMVIMAVITAATMVITAVITAAIPIITTGHTIVTSTDVLQTMLPALRDHGMLPPPVRREHVRMLRRDDLRSTAGVQRYEAASIIAM